MANQRRAGLIQLQVTGEIMDASGNFDYNLGIPKKEGIVGANGVPLGFKEIGQIPFIEGEIIDRGTLDVAVMLSAVDQTVTLKLANGKSVALYDAYFAGEGTASSEDAKIKVRWEGSSAKEI